MPKVTIEYFLPEDKKALEDSIMGGEAAGVLEKLRAWLYVEQLTAARTKRGTPEHDYGRGIGACLGRLDKLLKGEDEAPEPPPPED